MIDDHQVLSHPNFGCEETRDAERRRTSVLITDSAAERDDDKEQMTPPSHPRNI
jgi:hypothetical protein